MGLAQGFGLQHEVGVQVGIVFADPGLNLVPFVADNEDDFFGGDVFHQLQDVAQDGVAGYVEEGFGPAPGVGAHATAEAAQKNDDFHMELL